MPLIECDCSIATVMHVKTRNHLAQGTPSIYDSDSRYSERLVAGCESQTNKTFKATSSPRTPTFSMRSSDPYTGAAQVTSNRWKYMAVSIRPAPMLMPMKKDAVR